MSMPEAEVTLCRCGCGKTVKTPGRRWAHGHNPATTVARLDAARKRKEAREASIPFCGCGCGQRCTLPTSRYRPGHNAVGKRPEHLIAMNAARPTIPRADFKAAVTKIRKAKGWTLQEMADRVGISLNLLKVTMYRTDSTVVNKDWARWFFARLAGAPATMPPRQARIQTADANKKAGLARHIENAYGIR